MHWILHLGGTAFVGRGLSDNVPVEIAGQIRSRRVARGFDLGCNVEETAK